MAAADATPLSFRDSDFTSFSTFWAARTVIRWPNVPFDPQVDVPAADSAFVGVNLLGASGGEGRQGVKSFMREGSMTIQIYTRAGRSTDEVYSLANAVLEFFELRSTTKAEDGYFKAARSVEIGPDGTWYQLDVTADYIYFTNR